MRRRVAYEIAEVSLYVCESASCVRCDGRAVVNVHCRECRAGGHDFARGLAEASSGARLPLRSQPTGSFDDTIEAACLVQRVYRVHPLAICRQYKPKLWLRNV